MKIRIIREHNDNLINNGVKTKDDFICDPKDFNHEMIGWYYEQSEYCKITDELIIELIDETPEMDYES